MKENSNPNNFQDKTQLSEAEATLLASELKKKLLEGKLPSTDKDLIKKIIAGLGDRRGMLRRTFSESLGLIGNTVIPELRIALLNNPNVIVRRAAAKTLRLVGDSKALPDLLKALLEDQDPVVQGSAVGAMAIFGEEAIPHLIQVLDNPKSSEMQCGLASWGLSYVGANGSKALKEATKSTNKKVRACSIAALGEQIQSYDDKEAKNILINALNDPSDEVKIEAIKLIGMLNDQQWNNHQIGLNLNHQNSQIRKQSALSLMKLKAIDQLSHLETALETEQDQEVIKIINLSIRQIKVFKKD
ncbi:HEAT repeat domain-containing protein [Prochlorococcus marinus]|uniref:HEAT repeat domain-containing protein n=1 Tax=Prochlorococcus marinus TaxID=1219 RepID=UPI0022B38913|nr:HEAT repeat domain-containing protein [Prochlorococcus marinus]